MTEVLRMYKFNFLDVCVEYQYGILDLSKLSYAVSYAYYFHSALMFVACFTKLTFVGYYQVLNFLSHFEV